MRLQPGSMFAGYAIERPLGAGGMGVVYLARHPRLQRSVALKVLNDAFAHDAKARARFEREAALITALDHPNIVPIYDRNSPDDEILWISMKFVEGGDAASVLAHAGGRVTPERAVRMIGDAGRALDHAHLHGVLHRDVKPANLLVEHGAGTFERTMVTDFGIARSVEDSETGSRVSATLAYTAPERFGGGPVDHRADLYSLGCTLFKLLTGEPPFARSDDAAVIAAHLHAPLPRLTDVRPGLPGGLDEVLATVLAKNPHDRYPDCESFAAAARAAVDRSGETVVARHLPDHTPSTPRRLWLGEDAETAPAPRLPSIPVANEHDSTRDAGTHATSASGRTDSAADPGPPHARGSFSPAAEQKSAGTGVHRTGSGQPGAGTDAHLAHNTHTEDNTRVDAGFLGRTAQPDDYGTRDAQGSDDRIAGGSRTSSAPGRSPEGAPPGGGRPGSGGIHPDPRPGGDGDDAGDATASERAHPAARRAYTQPDSGDARGDGGMFPGGASAEFAGGGHSAGGTAAGRTAPRGVLTRSEVRRGG
ncbi:protein kinase [Nocardia sp. NPDC005978]|uniref:serine/threonine-protein kinase n=1 Tax=Nocardia sp. NPDC005978 TaxID=3156725 RepID=UPI00339FC427